MNDKLVSIITPCFNGEKFAARFFENILEQTYQKLELYFINDGSTDDTEKIALAYQEKLQKAGIQFHYIYQENAGQAAAVNQGLAQFSGDYFMWTDSDDLLDADNIEKKVQFLDTHPDYAFVMCRGRCVLDSDLDTKVGELKRIPPNNSKDMFFRDMLLEKNIVFTPGVYMVRREAFLQVCPSRHIYESRVGQNWQILLPLSYHYQCGYIKEELFSYVIRNDSHSHSEKTLSEVLQMLHRHDETLRIILTEMGLADSEYMIMLKAKLIRKEFDNAYHYKDKNLMKKKYRELSEMKCVTKRDTLIYYAGLNILVDRLYSIFKSCKKWYRSKR